MLNEDGLGWTKKREITFWEELEDVKDNDQGFI